MMLRKIARAAVLVVLVLLAALLLPNARSLYEGIFFYLRDIISPSPIHPISRTGRYASLFDLIQLRNGERRDYILSHLEAGGMAVTRIPVPDSQLADLLVRFNAEGPYTVYSAHYDKLYDDVAYQGASDNTAAVSVLLATAVELQREGYRGRAAFLFTGEEEKGLRGAIAFMNYVHATRLPVRENVNFDNVGRGKLAIRPSVQIPGYSFTVPFYGDLTYDGRTLRPSPPYAPANPRLTQDLVGIQPDMVVYEHFTATSDSNIFQANGIDTVAISGDDMHYLEETWHTYADRVELLDEQNLDRAYDLILRYAQAN
ncbi:MAG TPA: M20/M25/M40 family metallo-hydrolase [Anaerolineae bacterium]